MNKKDRGNHKGKRMLLCMYNFPPIGGVRSIRWAHLVRALYQQGWTIDVLTVQPSPNDSFYDRSILKVVPEDIPIYRSFPGPLYAIQHFRRKPIKGYPKLTIEWLPFGLLRGILLVQCRKYDLIVSSGLPFVGHILAFFLKQIGTTPWIADYGDSIGFNPITGKWKRRFGKMIERILLLNVSGLIVPFPEMITDFISFYPFLNKKSLQSIRHGVSEKIHSGPSYHRSDKMRITFAGSFYIGENEPFEFLKGFHNLIRSSPEAKIEFVIAGNTQKRYIDAISQMDLMDRITLLGQIPYNNAVDLLKQSDFILYIGGLQKNYHFAFKIIESAAIGRPIIAIKQSEMDMGAKFIQEHRIGAVISNDEDVIALKLRELYALWKSDNLELSFDKMPPEQFFWSRRADEMNFYFAKILNPENNKLKEKT